MEAIHRYGFIIEESKQRKHVHISSHNFGKCETYPKGEDDEDVDDEDDDGKRAVGSNQCDWEGRTSPSFAKK